MKKVLSLFLVIILILSVTPSVYANAATLKLNKSKVIMGVDDIYKLTLGKVSGSKISWTSSKKSVATISRGGTLTAKASGKTTITAKYNNKKYICTVKVNDYSKWIVFGTNNYDYVRDGILAGEIVYYYDDYYLVSPKYYEKEIEPQLKAISDAEEDYANHVYDSDSDGPIYLDPEFSTGDNSDESNADDDAALQDRINRILNEGVSSASSSD